MSFRWGCRKLVLRHRVLFQAQFLYWEQTYSKYDVIFVPVIVQMFDVKCNNVLCYTCGIGFENKPPG